MMLVYVVLSFILYCMLHVASINNPKMITFIAVNLEHVYTTYSAYPFPNKISATHQTFNIHSAFI